MKILKEYLNNHLSDEDIILYIQTELNNIDSRTLNKIYTILNDKLESTPEVIKEIDEFFKIRRIDGKIQRNIKLMFEDYGEWMKLIQLIRNKQDLPTSRDLLKHNNVYQLFDGLGFDIELLKELAEFNPPKNNVATGNYEILCKLLLNDIDKTQTKGDIKTILSGTLELKKYGGRVKGQTLKSPKEIDDEFKRIIYDNYKYKIDIPHSGIFSGKAAMTTFFNQLKSKLNIEDNVLCEIMAKSIAKQFTDDQNEYMGIYNFMANHQTDFLNKGKITPEVMTQILGTIDMHFYQLTDGWNYMIAFKEGNGGDYIKIKGKDALDYEYIYNNKSIRFAEFIRSQKAKKPEPSSSYDYAVRIQAI